MRNTGLLPLAPLRLCRRRLLYLLCGTDQVATRSFSNTGRSLHIV